MHYVYSVLVPQVRISSIRNQIPDHLQVSMIRSIVQRGESLISNNLLIDPFVQGVLPILDIHNKRVVRHVRNQDLSHFKGVLIGCDVERCLALSIQELCERYGGTLEEVLL